MRSADIVDAAALMEIRSQSHELAARRGAGLPDRASAMIYAQTSCVLAAFRVLEGRLGNRREAYRIVRNAQLKAGKRIASNYMRLSLFFTRNPIAFYRRSDLENFMRRLMGSVMQVQQENGTTHIDLVIQRCAYFDFFHEEGEPALTRILCAWDRPWMEAFEKSGRNIHVERPAAFSQGNIECRFRFAEGPATSANADVVDPLPELEE